MEMEDVTELRERLEKAERALRTERRDRLHEEKRSLELLDEVKKKWEAKEEERIKQKDEELDSVRSELTQTLEVKKGLKAKLRECRERLDEAIHKYEEERRKNAGRHGQAVLGEGAENKPPGTPAGSPEKEHKPSSSSSSSSDCVACEDLRAEMKLQRVEIRLSERKAREAESRLKFVREVMLREEKEAREKAEAKLKETEEAAGTAREAARKEAEEERSKLVTRMSELEKEAAKVSPLEKESRDRAAEAAELRERLAKVEEGELRDLREREAAHQTLKVTCLELQDQLAEYEKVSAKLETQLEEARMSEEKSNRERGAARAEAAELGAEAERARKEAEALRSLFQEMREAAEAAAAEKGRSEEEWAGRMGKMDRINAEQAAAFAALKEEFDRAVRQSDNLERDLDATKDQNMQLKESVAEYHTKSVELEGANAKLHSVMEEMLQKVAARNEEIKEKKEKLHGANEELERKTVQINQLKKLVDHLRSGGKEGTDRTGSSSSSSGDSKRKPPLEWAMSYEEVQEELDRERGRSRQLAEELKQARTRAMSEAASAPLEESAVRELALRRPVAQTAHAIPHHFHKVTHMKAGQKCPVCTGSLPLCRAVSQCKFCHRVVHVGCEDGAGADCGLSSDLALVLKSNAGNSEGVLQKGYLKVPEGSPSKAGRSWRSVPVQIVKEHLIVDNGKADIHLCPEKGFVFIQGTVAYSELSHTPAFDQPHVFKVGYSHGSKIRETRYFMAKTFQEKAAWIDALEKVTLTGESHQNDLHRDKRKEEKDDGGQVFPPSPSKKEANGDHLVDFDVLAAFAADSTVVFCALPIVEDEGGRVLFGTSQGLLMGSAKHSPGVRPVFAHGVCPEGVFQLARLDSRRELLMVVGPERRLVVAKEEDVLPGEGEQTRERFRYRNIEIVSSCHRFVAREFEAEEGGRRAACAYVCAVDDRRVSILARTDGTGEYQRRYGFSTDLPTSCLSFSCAAGAARRTVLVATDKVYAIGLEDFEVRELVDPALAPSVFAENRLIDVFALGGGGGNGEEEYLLCFQDYGLFVDGSGRRSRGDVRWSGIAGQFHLTRGDGGEGATTASSSPRKNRRCPDGRTLWIAKHDGLEAVGVDDAASGVDASGFLRLRCRNPHLLSTSSAEGGIVFSEKKADSVIVRMMNRK